MVDSAGGFAAAPAQSFTFAATEPVPYSYMAVSFAEMSPLMAKADLSLQLDGRLQLSEGVRYVTARWDRPGGSSVAAATVDSMDFAMLIRSLSEMQEAEDRARLRAMMALVTWTVLVRDRDTGYIPDALCENYTAHPAECVAMTLTFHQQETDRMQVNMSAALSRATSVLPALELEPGSSEYHTTWTIPI